MARTSAYLGCVSNNQMCEYLRLVLELTGLSTLGRSKHPKATL